MFFLNVLEPRCYLERGNNGWPDTLNPGTKLTHTHTYTYIYIRNNNNSLAHYFSLEIHLLSLFSHFFFLLLHSSSFILNYPPPLSISCWVDPVLPISVYVYVYVCVCAQALNARNQRRNVVVETETGGGEGKRRRRGHFLIFRG